MLTDKQIGSDFQTPPAIAKYMASPSMVERDGIYYVKMAYNAEYVPVEGMVEITASQFDKAVNVKEESE